MDEEKILYEINVQDVINVSEEIEINFTEKDIEFIQEKIGDFMGDSWYAAVEFALEELETRETE